MAEFPAVAVSRVGDFDGDCVIIASKDSICVNSPTGETIGKWQYNQIRKFRARETQFIFDSGSRGQFGVGEYRFNLELSVLNKLQKTITGHTGAKFSSKIPAHKTSSVEKESDVETSIGSDPLSPGLLSPAALLDKVRGLLAEEGDPTQADEAQRRSRGNVYSELVKTEHDYVADLKIVIDAYYDAMDPDSLSIPLRLRGKRETVFGNLQDIYKFHDSVFSPALDMFVDCPERVGDCFMLFVTEFEMYTVYCKNRPRSEVLVNDSTESVTFFKGIQMTLSHQLDLNSYLLKPVQRITKYQLLLKDLLKHCKDLGPRVSGLDAACNKMKKILQDLNDSMHTAGLKELPDDLPGPGKLLAHDRFQVSGLDSGHLTFSRNRGRSEKHVFLFEKVIVLSKRTETESKKGKKTEAYQYKDHLDMTDVSLRESVHENPLTFGLKQHKEKREIKFEAQSREVQVMWVEEIRRLLQLQFAQLKKKVDSTTTPPVIKRTLDVGTRKLSESSECLISSAERTEKAIRRRSVGVADKPAKNKLDLSARKRTTSSPPDQDPPPEPPPLPPRGPQLYEVPYSVPFKTNGMTSPTDTDKPKPADHPSLPKTNGSPTNSNSRKISAHLTKSGFPIDPRVHDAIDDIQSEEKEKSWIVCGFLENDHKKALTVIGQGEGSVESLKQYLEDDTIAFALIKIIETVDGISRPRFVFIQWIGEKSKTMAKAKTTTHRAQLEDLFGPFQAAVFASSLSDISDRVLTDKLTKISGSKIYGK